MTERLAAAKEPIMLAYKTQRMNARRRGIPWLLTFKQWWRIWQRSGKFEKRGHRLGQYVMARHRDKGPYTVGNVSIISCSLNHSQNNGKGSRKLTRLQARQIKREYVRNSPTHGLAALAKKYGLAIHPIWQVVKGVHPYAR